MTDIETTWTPSFCILRGVSEAGGEWVIDHTGRPQHLTNDDWDDAVRHVEHRYLADIVLGARADGLTVETTN
jgi:hypothetical protein